MGQVSDESMEDAAHALGTGLLRANRAQGHAESPLPPTDPGGVNFSVQVPPVFGIGHQLRHLLGA